MKGNFVPIQPEILYAGKVPLPPSVRPVIILSGSEFDMGYQWYQQLVQIYGPKPLKERAYRRITTEERKVLKAIQWYIKNWVPEMIDLLRGMVAGAKDAGIPLSYEEVLAKWSIDAFRGEADQQKKIISAAFGGIPRGWTSMDSYKLESFPGLPESEDVEFPAEDNCSGFAAWGKTTRDGKLVCGGNGDHQIILGENEINNFEYIVAIFPKEGNNFVFSTSTGCCWHPAMNNKGVAMFHHGCSGYLDRFRKPEEQNFSCGVPNTMITMRALRFANNADQAKDIVLSLPTGDGRIGGAWADVSGDAFVIENRDNPRCIRMPGDNEETDFIYSTNNLFSRELRESMIPPPDGNVFIPHGGWFGTGLTLSSVPRNLELWNMLHYYQGHVDLDFAMMMYRFPAEQPAYPTLEEADAKYYTTQGKGWNQRICTLQNAMVGVLQPDNGNKGLYYVSNGCLARTGSPFQPRGHYYRIAPTYTFYELKLESDHEKLTLAAKDRAQYDLYYANRELRKLNYGDCAYAPLDQIFNQAAIEWQKGEYHLRFAKKTKGNESLNYWGKTTRAFTRCQALARQVYESLVPPASNPEGLGLKSWEYWTTERE
ncbi:MAG: hypothetical protein WCO26_06505 [Deltaproteobacteria bacterium]